MSLRRKVQNFFLFPFFSGEENIFKDASKYTLIVGKMLIGITNLWPEDCSLSKKISFMFMAMIGLVHEASLFASLFVNGGDMDSFTQIISSTSPGFQCLVKGAILYFKSKELSDILKQIRYDFWPSDLMGKELEDIIAKQSKSVLLLVTLLEYGSAVIAHSLWAFLPMTSGVRATPFRSWYPFDWTRTPLYQIVYILEVYIVLYATLHIVIGYDALYCAICSNCVTQFRLLCAVIKKVGTKDEEELTEKLRIYGSEYELGIDEHGDKIKLLIICMRHHQKLINASEKLNQIFGNGHFVQLCASLMAICTTCYRISKVTHIDSQILLSLTYYMGHMFQLFLYCSASHGLSDWSTRFSTAAFECLWYDKEYAEVKRCLIMVMMRSQKALSMNAFGLFELNYASFTTVVRFSFSLYTFLNKMSG